MRKVASSMEKYKNTALHRKAIKLKKSILSKFNFKKSVTKNINTVIMTNKRCKITFAK